MWSLGMIVLLIAGTLAFRVPKNQLSLESIVDIINTNKTSLWEAGHNFDLDTDIADLKRLAGTRELNENDPELKEFIDQMNEIRENSDEEESGEDDLGSMGCKNAKGLPQNFDAREKWYFCKSISHISDQSNCGSCWAVSVADAISDRLCIATNGFFQGQVSGQQVLSCTPKCGGCNGGWPQLAWKYWGHNGVVTGGDYASKEGCQPYQYPPCSHRINGTHPDCKKGAMFKTTECKRECYNPGYEATYSFDLKKGQKARMVSRCNAMRQIYEHGPLVAIFTVYADFLTYKKGIYQHITGDNVGLHAVRVLGWGIEDGVPYWLVANSWNSEWGDKGTFKILRGENEANVEMGFNVGFPSFLRF